jgi:ADP-dependent NAD(P)H-hydrate dehydratase / NAD(P)H-hydrate epimerase
MISQPSGPILTAQQMQGAERAMEQQGVALAALMDRAGLAIADAVVRFAGPAPVLILCGHGNNGGDGYVAARLLKEWGREVRIAALSDPVTDLAKNARALWGGPVEDIATVTPAPVIVDALFGTGLTRALDASLVPILTRLRDAANLFIAVDVPSGVGSDDGAHLGAIAADITIALGALKPAHLLFPAAAQCGRTLLADIGIAAHSSWSVLPKPKLAAPDFSDHKYTRGMVIIAAGDMPGASVLAATAAQRAGAGYVVVAGSAGGQGYPAAVVHRDLAEAVTDVRARAAVIGPGLGLDDTARQKLESLIESDLALVIDGDALTLLSAMDSARLSKRRAPVILTPHGGEFSRLFGATEENSKIRRTVLAAQKWGATVIFKGAETVIAAQDGRACVTGQATHWLATAGTGDVLAGVCGAMLARGLGGFEAGCAAVWLHGEAARLAGPGLIADDLPAGVRRALVSCA